MSSRPRSRVLALGLSLVPGWGHVYWGREVLGLAVFTAFALAGFALFNGIFIYLGDGREFLVRGSAGLVLGIVGWTWFDIICRTGPRRLKAEEEERDHNLREGMIAYLRGDHEGAKALFRSCVRADPFDVEALFRMGVACSRTGDIREAAVWLRRTRRHDLEDKWRWEIAEELKKLKRAGRMRRRALAPSAPQEAAKAPATPAGGSAKVQQSEEETEKNPV